MFGKTGQVGPEQLAACGQHEAVIADRFAAAVQPGDRDCAGIHIDRLDQTRHVMGTDRREQFANVRVHIVEFRLIEPRADDKVGRW